MEILKYADFAIQYADEDVKQEYIAQTQEYRDFVESVRNQVNQQPVSQPKKSKKGWIIGLIILAVSIIIGRFI